MKLKPGATKLVLLKTALPSTLTPGAYYTFARIDEPSVLTESDETNNLVISSGTFNVTAG